MIILRSCESHSSSELSPVGARGIKTKWVLMDESLDHRSTFGSCSTDSACCLKSQACLQASGYTVQKSSASGAIPYAYGVRDDQARGATVRQHTLSW